MTKCSIGNATGHPSRIVVLHAEGSGRIEEVAVRAPADVRIVACLRRFDRWIGLVLAAPIDPGQAIDLEIRRSPSGQDGSCSGSFRGPNDPLLPPLPFAEVTAASRLPGGAPLSDVDLRALVRRLEVASLAGSSSPVACRQAAMFWWMDSQSHPRLLTDRAGIVTWPAALAPDELAFRLESIVKVSEQLSRRATKRQQLARSGVADPSAFANAMMPIGVDRGRFAYVAEFMRRSFAALDGAVAGKARCDDDVDPGKVAQAMIAFAAGDLWLECDLPAELTKDPRLSECGPDGPFFFLFAEMALVAARMKLHGDFWAKTLPGFVAAQLCYRRAYGDPNRASTRVELLRAANRPPKLSTPADAREIELLRLQAMSLDELEVQMGANLHATMSDLFT